MSTDQPLISHEDIYLKKKSLNLITTHSTLYNLVYTSARVLLKGILMNFKYSYKYFY